MDNETMESRLVIASEYQRMNRAQEVYIKRLEHELGRMTAANDTNLAAVDSLQNKLVKADGTRLVGMLKLFIRREQDLSADGMIGIDQVLIDNANAAIKSTPINNNNMNG